MVADPRGGLRLASSVSPADVSTARTPDVFWPAPVCNVIEVSSDQPGDGQWTVTGSLAVTLRADRDGLAARHYLVTVRCTTSTGNTATGTTTITVQHDRGHRS